MWWRGGCILGCFFWDRVRCAHVSNVTILGNVKNEYNGFEYAVLLMRIVING